MATAGVAAAEVRRAREADELASWVADCVADAKMTSVMAEDRNPEALNWRAKQRQRRMRQCIFGFARSLHRLGAVDRQIAT